MQQKNERILQVIGVCLFVHLFVLGLTGSEAYDANVDMQLAHLERGSKIISSILTEIHSEPGNLTVEEAFDACRDYLSWYNFEMLVDHRELMLVQRVCFLTFDQSLLTTCEAKENKSSCALSRYCYHRPHKTHCILRNSSSRSCAPT